MSFNMKYSLNFAVNLLFVLFLVQTWKEAVLKQNDTRTNCKNVPKSCKRNITKFPSRETLTAMVYCQLQPNAYDCSKANEYEDMFYYDIKMGDCVPIKIGTCPCNYNKFNTRKTCRNECKAEGVKVINCDLEPVVYCRLQPDFGKCDNYHPMWYYDVTERNCKGFSFSGCGGNKNRFETRENCLKTCSGLLVFENL